MDPPYRHGTFDVVAFPVHGSATGTYPGLRPYAHCIIIRRRADGFTTTIAAWIWQAIRAAYDGK